MCPKKKLFESDDFDKRKKLFTSSDFDKEKESEEIIPVEQPKDEKNGANFRNWIFHHIRQKPWIFLLGIIGVVVLCVIFSKSGDTIVTEPGQRTEVVEETIAPTDSLANKEETTEEGLTADENEVSNNADDQEAKVNETPATTDSNSNIAMTTASNPVVSNDVEAEALKVIRGDYGDGQERKDKLGANYQTIQSRVNELKREGAF